MIRKISFPETYLSAVGLAPQGEPMAGLGRLVVLAGPNGAGKTRYLGVLERLVQQTQIVHAQMESLEARRLATENRIIAAKGKSEALRRAELERIDAECSNFRMTPGFQALSHLDASNLGAERLITLTYDLNKATIQRAEYMTLASAVQIAKANVSPGFSTAYKSMHAYFTQVARALWHAEDPRMKGQPGVAENADDAAQFSTILDLLVGGHIEPSLDENQDVRALFRGRPFNPAELSDGESVLVTWAIILHRQKETLSDAILLIDEPENHLHPDACIQALRALRDKILGPHGQIWLATHSVQLIAFAGTDAVWLVDSGRIEYAGNKIDKVIERLLGGEEGRDQLRAFLADADALGFYKFAAECLTSPDVAATKPDDPQEAQLVKLVRDRVDPEKPLRLLDFGAGKGRLAAALRATRAQRAEQGAGDVAAVDLAYYGYNGAHSPASEVAECRERVAELGSAPGVQAEYVKDLRSLSLETSPKMDLVVLCNVLHEIPVTRWCSVFEDIATVLSLEGSLLIMEDQHMRVGELPTAHGFVVLDAIELAALFGAKPGEEIRELPAARGGRLTQIAVSARVLPNANAERIKKALGLVLQRAGREVKRLRDTDRRTFQDGRLHAYYSMLYMNAMLAHGAFG